MYYNATILTGIKFQEWKCWNLVRHDPDLNPGSLGNIFRICVMCKIKSTLNWNIKVLIFHITSFDRNLNSIKYVLKLNTRCTINYRLLNSNKFLHIFYYLDTKKALFLINSINYNKVVIKLLLFTRRSIKFWYLLLKYPVESCLG